MKLLICLAFHYVESNLIHLKKVLNNIVDNYQYETHIIIDTNSSMTVDAILPLYPTVEINIVSNLPDPHMLTSVHRIHMSDYIDNYDLVMYCEDDVLIPFQCVSDFVRKIDTM